MHFRTYFACSAMAVAMLWSQQPDQAGRTSSDSNNSTQRPKAAITAEEKTDSAHDQHGASMLGPKDEKFMMDAARGGLAEVRLAQIAQQKASSEEVKQYARQLEQDHTKANEQLKAIAQERSVQLPSDLGQHQKTVDMLNSLSGEAFDRAYIKAQVKDHKKDIGEFRKASQNSMDSDLKTFASSTLPTLESHLSKAQTLESQTGTRSRKQ